MYKILCSGMGYDGGYSGVAEYMRETIRHLCKHCRVELLLLENDIGNFTVRHANLKIIPVSGRYAAPWRNVLWHLMLPFNMDMRQYDFVFLPAGNRRLFWKFPRPTAVTFHDLAPVHTPENYGRLQMFYLRHIVPRLLKKAQIIMPVSKSTRDDMVALYHFSPERLLVNHNGFDSTRFYPTPRHDEQEILARLKLPKEYILYVARIEHPAKNHLNLLKGYEMLPEWLKKKHPLVCAGNLWHNWEKVIGYAENSLDRENIFFPGFVPDEWLPCLYHNAFVYACPSMYEGFGFPLLEAMSCGIPAICSDRSSLPEIGGDAVMTFEPESPESICRIIRNILTDPLLREEMIRKGYTRKEEFSWDKHVENIIAACERYIGRAAKHPDRDSSES